MNEMRKLMEATADLDFNAPVDPLPAPGKWITFYRDSFGEEQVVHRGTYDECVRGAKQTVKNVLNSAEGDIVTKKRDRKDGGFDYHMQVMEADWHAYIAVERFRDYEDYNPHLNDAEPIEEGSGDVRGEFLSLVQSIQRSDDSDAIDNLIVDLVDALTDEQTAELLALWGPEDNSASW